MPSLPRPSRRQSRVRAHGEFPDPGAAGFPGRVHATRSTGCPIPPKGAHLIRYYGWYSNKARGMRRGTRLRVAAEAAAAASLAASSSGEAAQVPAPSRSSQTWAMLIKRVYELDPLACPRCGGQMKVIAFIEPPQADVTCLPVGRSRGSCGTVDCGVPRRPGHHPARRVRSTTRHLPTSRGS